MSLYSVISNAINEKKMYCDYFIIHVELIYDDYYHVIAYYILIDRCVQLIYT